ncbi:MAG TPA: hypothetical protein V6C85_29585 [Allocoleopsis sp.]
MLDRIRTPVLTLELGVAMNVVSNPMTTIYQLNSWKWLSVFQLFIRDN